MAVADLQLIATPTGLMPEQVLALPEADARVLATWQVDKSGDDDGRLWLPAAVRRLPLESRLALATDPERDAAWERRERLRVAESPVYFTNGYGHVQAEEGPPDPFLLWPEQRQIIEDFHDYLRVVVLKARQLGLTWAALHYGAWLAGFCQSTPKARILCLSQKGEDASKLLRRVRRIYQLLPPYLRLEEDEETKRSKSEFQLVGRGGFISLAGTPSAARSETATLAIVDEAAFIRHGGAQETFTALTPTLGRRGKAIFVSTGNGDEETPGDGQAFARLYRRARSGEELDAVTTKAVFLPTSVHPERDETFYERARRDFDSEEDFRREYPETEEEALQGRGGVKVFPLDGINAAERLGRRYDEMLENGILGYHNGLPPEELIPPPVGDAVCFGIDWGMGETAVLLGWELEQGGIYVPPQEVVVSRAEPGEVTHLAFERLQALQHPLRDGRMYPPLGDARFDAAGAQSMATFVATARTTYRGCWARDMRTQRQRVRATGIPFGADSGTGSGKGFKQETVGYLRRLFKRTAEGRTVGVIAISPKNRTLLRQLRALEHDDKDSSKIRKVDDHAPDALIAMVAPVAVKWRVA